MKAIIFIHGYLSTKSDFINLPKMVESSYDEVFEITLPGHGEDGIKNFTYPSMIKIITEVIPKIINNFDKVDIVGFSLGGAIARFLAINYPINRLVLLAPANKYFSPFLLYRRSNYLFQTITSDGLLNQGSLIKKYWLSRKALFRYDKDAIKFFCKVILPKFRPSNGITFMRLIKYMNKTKGIIKAPTLIIWGYLDELVPCQAALKCFEIVKNEEKELLIVPNIGHMLLRKESNDLLTKITNFLKG